MYNKKRLTILFAILILGMMLCVACVPTPANQDKPDAKTEETAATDAANTEDVADKTKVFISFGTGGLGDLTYNDMAYAGAKRAVEDFGVELQIYEPKSLSEIEAQMLAIADSGEYDLILGIGMDNSSAIDKASDAYPDQTFAIYQAAYDKPNVISSNQAVEEGAYQIGILVASLYKANALPGVPEGTNKLGVVLGMAGGEINQQVFSLTAGGKTIDPKFEVISTEIGDWSDTAKAKELAVALTEKGCGVIFQYAGGAGLGIYEAAKETGGYCIGSTGYQNDQCDTVICSRIEDMDATIYNTIKEFTEGTLKSGNIRYGLKSKVVYLDFSGSKVVVPDEIMQLVNQAGEDIISGKIKPPTSQSELDAFIATLK
ncbi:MAG: BMP family ABC transporter substrate-binding protein [Clostridia bacterium]